MYVNFLFLLSLFSLFFIEVNSIKIIRIDKCTQEQFLRDILSLNQNNYTIEINLVNDDEVNILYLNKIIDIMNNFKEIKYNCVIYNAVGLAFHLTRFCTFRKSFENSVIGILKSSSGYDGCFLLESLEKNSLNSLNLNKELYMSKLPWISSSFQQAYEYGFSDILSS